MVIITIGADGKPSERKLTISNKFENIDEILEFKLPANFDTYNKYLIGVLEEEPNNRVAILPVLDNRVAISSMISYYPGKWQLYLMAREMKIDLDKPKIDISAKNNEHVFISDPIMGIVRDNLLNKEQIENVPLDANLQIIYDELMALITQVRTDLENGNYDGISPIVSFNPVSGGNEMSVTDRDGTKKILIKDGKNYEHSEEFSQLAEQVRQDKLSADASAKKAQESMNATGVIKGQVDTLKASIDKTALDIASKSEDVTNKHTQVTQAAQQVETNKVAVQDLAKQVQTNADSANASKESAALSAQTASTKAQEALTSATNAKASETASAKAQGSAEASAGIATTKAQEALKSAQDAAQHNANASTSSTEATKAATQAQASASSASQSEANAKASETASKESETNAHLSEEAALTSKNAAKASENIATAKATEASKSAAQTLESKNAASTSATQASNSAQAAKASETSALASASSAKASEDNASASEINAKTSETNAKASAANAKQSETNSKTSETNAKTSETKAKASETTASTKASEASTSAQTASQKATIAETSANKAKASETNAKTSETNASKSAAAAKASETATGQVVADATAQADRAKTEADRAKTNADTVASSSQKITENAEQITQLKQDFTDLYDKMYEFKILKNNPVKTYIPNINQIEINVFDSKKNEVTIYHSKKNLVDVKKIYSDKAANVISFSGNLVNVQSPLGYASYLRLDMYLQKGTYFISTGKLTTCNGVGVYKDGKFFANGIVGTGGSKGKFTVTEAGVYTLQTYTIPNNTCVIDSLQVELSDVATSYEAYSGNVKKITVSQGKGSVNVQSFIGDNVIYSDSEELNIKFRSHDIIFENNNLKNKTIIMNGDSICEDVYGNRIGWVGRIGNRNGMTWKNYGVSGGTIAENVQDSTGATKHSVCGTIDKMYSEFPDADYVLFDGGTNDADLLGNMIGETPPRLGTFDLTNYNGIYDTSTFCGAFETICFKLSKYWKHAKVGYIVAQKMGVSKASGFTKERHNRRAYFDLAIQICNKWGIPVLNLWDETPLNPNLPCYYLEGQTKEQNELSGSYYLDGQHLTSHGYDWTSSVIENWIKKL